MANAIGSGAAAKTTSVHNTPFCGDLRSKKFFQLTALPQSAEDFLDPSGYCWCYHSQNPIGPDGEIVMPERCVPGRKCYRSALSDVNKK
jgi:hypothetical protein